MALHGMRLRASMHMISMIVVVLHCYNSIRIHPARHLLVLRLQRILEQVPREPERHNVDA